MALEDDSTPAHSTDDLRRMHAALDVHYASSYLNTWCYGPVRKEWAQFLHEVFEELMKNGKSDCDGNQGRVVLDVGCGPSMASVMSASRWSKTIYLCDYLKSNREEISKFCLGDYPNFLWEDYFRFVAQLESDTGDNKEDVNDDSWKLVDRRTREAVRGVYFCDVTITDQDGTFVAETGTPSSADVMIASLVLDVVSSTEDQMASNLTNLLTRLAPDGILVLQGSLGESSYTVGGAALPALTVDEAAVRRVFDECGLALERWTMCRKESVHYFAVLKRKS